MIIGVLVAVYTISAVSGIQKGIQILSRTNVILCVALFTLVLIIGPAAFIVDSYFSGFRLYLENFITMSVSRENTTWLNSNTVFYWGWFLGYGPMTAMFVARISRGRRIREIVLAVAVIAPLLTTVWFGVLGGSSIHYEITNPGSITVPFESKDGGLPAVMLATLDQLPLSMILIPAFIVLIVIFLATTGDSMAYTISMAISGQDSPPRWMRVFWAVMMGAVAAMLLQIGGKESIAALQSFIIITAVPVSLVLLPLLLGAPCVAWMLRREQVNAETQPAAE